MKHRTAAQAEAHPLEDHAHYQDPDRECDVVMKGGITSGVVYPHAVCELARRFRLRSVGGTSAGAIAAACAAAAELGRGAPQGGFARIASLPRRLGEHAPDGGVRLLSLFQPGAATRPLFALLLTAARPGRCKAARLWWALLRHGGLGTVLGALPALAIVVGLVLARSDPGWLGGMGLALLLVVGATVGALWRQLRALRKHVPRGLFGICTGLRAGAGRAPGLTEWLHEELQTLAGLDASAPPLTFADLRTKEIDLQVITTCLTHGRPYGLPGLRRTLYFDPAEFRRLFPEAVVECLERTCRQIVADDAQRLERRVEHAFMHPRLPLPKGDALPVLVAVRMSLAFPVLLSAVPLWDYDWGGDGTREESGARAGRDRVVAWARDEPEAAEQFFADPSSRPAGLPTGPRPERIWFSDGGISSNFPMHLFDGPVPLRPTVGLNLAYHEPGCTLPPDRRVALAQSHSEGIDEDWSRLAAPDSPGDETLLRFAGSILSSMQNWADSSLLKLPGYRDRFATVHLEADEGGMNLEMDGDVIAELAKHGGRAGVHLRERFEQTEGVGSQLTWTNHRWTRLRTTLDALEDWLEKLSAGLETDDAPSFEELVGRGSNDPPTSYKLLKDQRTLVADVLVRLRELNALVDGDPRGLRAGAPRPQPELRISPRTSYPESR